MAGGAPLTAQGRGDPPFVLPHPARADQGPRHHDRHAGAGTARPLRRQPRLLDRHPGPRQPRALLLSRQARRLGVADRVGLRRGAGHRVRRPRPAPLDRPGQCRARRAPARGPHGASLSRGHDRRRPGAGSVPELASRRRPRPARQGPDPRLRRDPADRADLFLARRRLDRRRCAAAAPLARAARAADHLRRRARRADPLRPGHRPQAGRAQRPATPWSR